MYKDKSITLTEGLTWSTFYKDSNNNYKLNDYLISFSTKLEYILSSKINNFIWMGSEKVLNLVSTIIVTLLLTKYLGAEELGVLSYVQSFMAIFTVFVALGLDSVIVKRIVQQPEHTDILLYNSFYIRLALSVLIIFLFLLYSIYSEKESIGHLILLQSLTLISYSFNSFALYFQSQTNNRPVMKVTMLFNFIGVISKLLFIFFEADLFLFILIDVVVLLASSIFIFVLFKNENTRVKIKESKFNIKVLKSLMYESWPLMLSSGAILLYAKLDQLMIKYYLSFEELGKYSVLVRISESWYFLPMIITTIFFPKIIKLKKQSNNEYNLFLQKLYFYLFWLGAFCALCIVFVVSPLITTYLGDEYLGTSKVIFILSLSGVFVSLGYVNGRWMVAESLTKLSLYRNLLGLVINIILNIIIIPHYGIQGAAYSTLASIFIASNLSLVLSRKTRKMFIIQNVAIIKFHFLFDLISIKK